MRVHLVVVTGLFVVLTHASATGQTLPVRNGRSAVAVVNGDAISLDEFVLQFGPSADRARLRRGSASREELEVLGRLVNMKLIVQEASRMGLDEAPDIQKQLDVTSRIILRDVLTERIVKDVKPDPAAVEKLYRPMVREWKTTSLLFQDEKAARRSHMEIANGTPFADVAARAAAAKTAKADSDAAYHPKDDYLPPIAEAIAPLEAGQLAPLVRIPVGFVVVKVLDIRYPQKPEARAEAQRIALDERQRAVMAAHEKVLTRDYAVINTAVLKSLDYEAAKPGIDALLKDTRVVADIKGGSPVTVADLTDYLRMQFFHGTDQAGQRKRMNDKKEDALTATLGRRLLNFEASKLGIDKTNAYRDRVNAERESLVFSSFVQRVILPESKMREEEVKQYYDGHLREYSSPEMLRLRSLAFTRRTAAENAMQKLREGADFAWLAANAEGLVDSGARGLLTFDGRPVTTDSMPAGMQKAVKGARAGESRLYASPEGYVYVLAVQQAIAPNPKSYDEVRETIATKLYDEKLKKGVEEYAGKLRAQSKVETYLKRVQ